MADTLTPSFQLIIIEIDGSPDTWGVKLNQNTTKIDTALASAKTTADGALQRSGGTLTGAVYSNSVLTTTARITAFDFLAQTDSSRGYYNFPNAYIAHDGTNFDFHGPGTATINGYPIWHTGNLNPAAYAPIDSPLFSNTVALSGTLPYFVLNRSGVYQWRESVQDNGSFALERWPNGAFQGTAFSVSPTGALYSLEMGDVRTYVETRAAAYADDRKNQSLAYTEYRFADLYQGNKGFSGRLAVSGTGSLVKAFTANLQGIADWSFGVTSGGSAVFMFGDTIKFTFSADGNINTPLFGALNDYINAAANGAATGAKNAAINWAYTNCVASIRTINGGEKRASFSNGNIDADGSGLLKGFGVVDSGSNFAIRWSYLQFYVNGAWVTV